MEVNAPSAGIWSKGTTSTCTWARSTPVFLLSWAAVAAALLASCASTTRLNGVWVNPDAVERTPASNVLVIGVNQDSTARRIYEDAVVTQLAGRGIHAQPSYRVLPELGPVPPPNIVTTVRQTGVSAVLVSRTVRETIDIEVAPGYSYGPAGFFGMWWDGAFSTAPSVYTAQHVDVETRLFDVRDLALIWSGSSTTSPTSSMQQTIAEFARVLIEALAEAKVIA